MRIVLHGPSGPTGLGYSVQGFVEGLQAIGHEVYWQAPPGMRNVDGQGDKPEIDNSWSVSGYHLIIDQPQQLDQRMPWHGFVPFFELPLRQDEWSQVKAGVMNRRIYCANPFIEKWAKQCNLPADYDKIRMIQLGAHTHPRIGVERKSQTICTVGKAEPRKGTWLLLEALQLIAKKAHLAIVHPLHNQEEQNKIFEWSQDHTVLPFTRRRDEILALLESCHVAVFPACAEGWNLGLTEALARGCIVVASDIDAHRYQYELLVAGIGEDAASKRMLLVPTEERPIRPHARWYPLSHYAGQKWLECNVETLASYIMSALSLPSPKAWEKDEFPLSWENAARQLLEAIDFPAMMTN